MVVLSSRQGMWAGATILGIWLSSILALSLLSCSGDRTSCPEPCPLPSGRAVVDCSIRVDQDGLFYMEAFSFAAGGVVRFPNTQGIEPDLVLMFKEGPWGIEGFLLTAADLVPAFYHAWTGKTFEDGQLLFAATTCVPDGAHLEPIGGMVYPYQVWGVKTHDDKFGKILIVDTFFCTQEYDSAGHTVSRSYGEVTFDWEYQPDGTRCFE
jgi:hypothetical protein